MTDQTQIFRRTSETIDTILEIKDENFIKKAELGSNNFEELLPVLQNTQNFCKQILNIDWEILPFDIFHTQITGPIVNLEQSLAEVITFSTKNLSNLSLTRRTLIEKVTNNYKEFYKSVLPYILQTKTEELENLSKKIDSEYNNLSDALKNQISALQSINNEELIKHTNRINSLLEKANLDYLSKTQQFDSLASKVEKLLELASISRHAKHFQDASKLHRNLSVAWLLATLAIGGITIWFGIYGQQYLNIESLSNDTFTPAYITQVLAPRATTLIILFYLFIMCTKNFKANNHNYRVNKHRQNALSTFQTFAESTDDPQTKAAVLLQTTQCIFSPQASGYTDKDSDPDVASKVIEIIKPATKS